MPYGFHAWYPWLPKLPAVNGYCSYVTELLDDFGRHPSKVQARIAL